MTPRWSVVIPFAGTPATKAGLPLFKDIVLRWTAVVAQAVEFRIVAADDGAAGQARELAYRGLVVAHRSLVLSPMLAVDAPETGGSDKIGDCGAPVWPRMESLTVTVAEPEPAPGCCRCCC